MNLNYDESKLDIYRRLISNSLNKDLDNENQYNSKCRSKKDKIDKDYIHLLNLIFNHMCTNKYSLKQIMEASPFLFYRCKGDPDSLLEYCCECCYFGVIESLIANQIVSNIDKEGKNVFDYCLVKYKKDLETHQSLSRIKSFAIICHESKLKPDQELDRGKACIGVQLNVFRRKEISKIIASYL